MARRPLRSKREKGIPLRPIRPSAAIRTQYQRSLEASVDKMTADVVLRATRIYAAHGLAMDASPINEAAKYLRRALEDWQGRFDALAPKLADFFTTKTQDRVDGQLQDMLRAAGFTVKLNMTAAERQTLQAIVAENVSLIKSIASKYLGQVEQSVMRSAASGRDMKALTDDLMQLGTVTRTRAAFIAKDQTNKATAALTKTREIELGLKARWLHSAGTRTPRPEHVAFSGQTYDPAKGAYLEGKWTWPGHEINCHCVSVPVIPGFDD